MWVFLSPYFWIFAVIGMITIGGSIIESPWLFIGPGVLGIIAFLFYIKYEDYKNVIATIWLLASSIYLFGYNEFDIYSRAKESDIKGSLYRSEKDEEELVSKWYAQLLFNEDSIAAHGVKLSQRNESTQLYRDLKREMSISKAVSLQKDYGHEMFGQRIGSLYYNYINALFDQNKKVYGVNLSFSKEGIYNTSQEFINYFFRDFGQPYYSFTNDTILVNIWNHNGNVVLFEYGTLDRGMYGICTYAHLSFIDPHKLSEAYIKHKRGI